jgi:prophage DNA circulation protein
MGDIQSIVMQGSYKAVPFNFTESSVTDGGGTIIHTYVNSSKIDYEEMGAGARSFNMNIYVHGTDNEYIANRDAFERKLKQGYGGELVHPVHGRLYVVVDGAYTLNERITEMGKASISVKFTVVERRDLVIVTATPQKVFSQAKLIAALNARVFAGADAFDQSEFIKKLNEGFSFGGYNISSISSLEQAGDFVKKLTLDFSKATEFINDPTKLGEFTAQLLDFEKGAFTSGVDLARGIFDLYGTAYNLIETAKYRFDFFITLFGFGDDEPTIPQTTRTRVEQANNQLLQKMITQSTALVYATAAAVETEYTTEDELNNANTTIQVQFQKILNDDITTQEQYTELQSQRVNFTEITKNLALDVSRIIEIPVYQTGLSTIIYQYYGVGEGADSFEELYSIIVSLNGLEETGSITGTIKIITQQGAL